MWFYVPTSHVGDQMWPQLSVVYVKPMLSHDGPLRPSTQKGKYHFQISAYSASTYWLGFTCLRIIIIFKKTILQQEASTPTDPMSYIHSLTSCFLEGCLKAELSPCNLCASHSSAPCHSGPPQLNNLHIPVDTRTLLKTVKTAVRLLGELHCYLTDKKLW